MSYRDRNSAKNIRGFMSAAEVARKRAYVTPMAWEIECPHCREVIQSPDNGSHFWTRENLTGRTTVRCGCGDESTLPALIVPNP